MVLPRERHRTAYFAKGSYFSYSSSHPKPSTLVYPAFEPEQGGLGTHLTMDMGGRIRFGPDTEWVDDPSDLTPRSDRLEAAIAAVQTYLPGIDPEAMAPDYCGFRTKLGPKGSGFHDFIIQKEAGFEGFVNLLGIESPGLTSSLAIAETVERLLYR
jgi:L-2-hydroxyglutarate oxidase LhgO